MACRHGAPRPPVLGHQLGQDVALEEGEAFTGHGHPFESDGYGRLSNRRLQVTE